MRIKHAPEGSEIICCGATAEVLNTGTMGTRVNVLTLKKVDYPGFVTGFQIWSNNTTVEPITETNTNPPKRQNAEVSTQIGRKLQSELFKGNIA